MKITKSWFLIALAIMFVFTLTACGGNNEDASADNSEEVTNEGTNENSDNEGENDEVEVEENTDSDETNENNEENADNEGNDGEAQAGGMITAGMYSAPGHQFNPIFYTDAYDANILDFTHEALVRQNESLEYVPHLAKEWEIDDDYTSITYYLNEGVKWHDGEEFTANDVYFTFASIADPDYIAAGGVRTEYVNKLVGYEDYVAGEADELVGIEVEDDYTVTFHFEEANITALYNTSFPIIPAHVFDEVAVADIPDHDASSRGGEVIGTGPYQLTEYIEGEQYVLTAHTDYWGGSPYLEGITWRVIEQSIMPGLLENGDLDMVAEPNGVPAADYERVDGLEQVNTFVTQDFGYQYMGIKHHHRTTEDVESGAINPDNWVENPKLQDERVRQAIVYALNREAMVDGLMHGMGTVLNAPFPEASWAYNADVVEQYNFDPDKANELLDEAGYEDVTGDGYREDPDGNEWTLNLDYPTGNEIRERTAPIIVDELGNVGIRVEMRNPREARAHFDLVEMDNTDWDLYLAGWSLATGDPDPFAIWETNQAYNYLRWNDETNDELIGKAVQAPEAFDQDYRTEVYYEWAQYVSEQVPQVFLYTSDNIYAYNASLKNVKELPTGIYQDSHLWYLEQ